MNKDDTVVLAGGNHMPVLGLGTWQLTDNTPQIIKKALELGYKMIDTSRDYGTQPGIGQGIKQSEVLREDLYVVTKVEEMDNAYQATKQNLAELGLEYADLVLIHRPPETGVGETLWQGLIRAKAEGLAKDIGVSNYSVDQIQGLIDISEEMPVVNQIEWSPFGYSQEMLDFCATNGIIIQAYSPLTRSKRFDNEKLQEVADSYGKTAAQIMIRWSIQMGSVPIVKAGKEEHLAENLDVFDFVINDKDMAVLDELNEHYSALSRSPNYL